MNLFFDYEVAKEMHAQKVCEAAAWRQYQALQQQRALCNGHQMGEQWGRRLLTWLSSYHPRELFNRPPQPACQLHAEQR